MATLTITTTAAQDTRIAAVFGNDIGPGQTANAAYVKADIIAYITNKVLTFERQAAAKAASDAVTPIAPT